MPADLRPTRVVTGESYAAENDAARWESQTRKMAVPVSIKALKWTREMGVGVVMGSTDACANIGTPK